MRTRPAVVLIALLSATACCATACSAPAGAPPGVPQRVELAYAGGGPVGGVRRVEVALGSTVELAVSSDVDEDLHVHGYDRLVEMPAGATAELAFTADIPGVFEAEAERSGTPLIRLEVR